MQNRGLLFIPDISGFSRFVNETEISHSRLIIQELLEILVNANQIGLEISEIEGDAILFYKFGDPPALKEIYRQVEEMFCAFHRNLIAYEHRRYCQCTACVSAVNLSLKVITHYGEFTDYNVKNFRKLIGRDIIVAHQLLKNDIPQHEYWLVTQNLLQGDMPSGLTTWMKWDQSSKKTESGEVTFQYTQLSELRNELSPDVATAPQLEGKVRMVSVSHDYETDIITLFHASGDFQYRSRWMVGVKEVEILHHYLPRVGMRCRCVMESGESVEYTSSYYAYQEKRIEFIEVDEKKKTATCFILERLETKRTRLTLEFYIEDTFFSKMMFRLGKKQKVEDSLNKSLQNLVPLAKELRIPTAVGA